MFKKAISLIVLVFAAAVIALLFFRHDAEKIAVVKPLRGPVIQAVYATGTVEPSVMIPIAARQSARLIALFADEGQKVEKGAVMGQLEDTDVSKNLEGLRSAANTANREYQRKLGLFKNKAASGQDVDNAKAARDTAEAAVKQTEAQLSYLKLIAPESGIVIRRDGEIGELIPANQPVLWMSCCAPLRISSEVDEEDISLVQPGQKVAISADAFPDKVFNGKVRSITPKGDPVARSYRVRIELEGETPLMIGMTAETNILTRENKNALLVPAGAVSNRKLWIVQGGVFKSVSVETGARTPKAVEIIDGIDDNAVVVMDAAAPVTEGTAAAVKLQDWQNQ